MIHIIGTGMDGRETLTREAERIIKESDILIGAKRMLLPFSELSVPAFDEYRTDRIVKIIEENSGRNISVLMSGDCGFYSGARKLCEVLKQEEVTVISGISTPVYFCSVLHMDWSDMHFVSLHGTAANIIRNVCTHRKTFFLLGGDITPADLCRRLCEYGLGDVYVYIGTDLAYPDERIASGKASEITGHECGYSSLSAVIAVNDNYEKYTRASIPDEEFIRGEVPMTKAEVRGTIVNGLDLGKDSICWDIGSGTGSVAVEMAMRCTDGTVYAVDDNAEACRLIKENSIRFRCDNISTVCGKAMDVIGDLPVPDSVFIGGSKGQLSGIIESAVSKNPSIKLTVSAVSLETVNEAIANFDKLGLECDVTQIAVTRTKRIGGHTMLSAENPIFIIKRKLK